MMRWDRDCHIKINFENLQSGLSERNFGEKSVDTYITHNTPFDWHTWPDEITLSVSWSQSTIFPIAFVQITSIFPNFQPQLSEDLVFADGF